MALTLASGQQAYDRALETYVDSLHDKYYGDEYGTCPWCGDHSLDSKKGRGWYEVRCLNGECGYADDDCREPEDNWDD